MSEITLLVLYKRRGKSKPLFAVRNIYQEQSRHTRKVIGYDLFTCSGKLSSVYTEVSKLGIPISEIMHKESMYDPNLKSKVNILIARCKYKSYSIDNISWVSMTDLATKTKASRAILARIHLFAKSPICLAKE